MRQMQLPPRTLQFVSQFEMAVIVGSDVRLWIKKLWRFRSSPSVENGSILVWGSRYLRKELG